jgi:hypothetical protein
MYVDQIDEVLKYNVPKAGIAGFFAESIQVYRVCDFIFYLVSETRVIRPINEHASTRFLCFSTRIKKYVID